MDAPGITVSCPSEVILGEAAVAVWNRARSRKRTCEHVERFASTRDPRPRVGDRDPSFPARPGTEQETRAMSRRVSFSCFRAPGGNKEGSLARFGGLGLDPLLVLITYSRRAAQGPDSSICHESEIWSFCCSLVSGRPSLSYPRPRPT